MASPELIVIKRWTWKKFASLLIAILLVLAIIFVVGYMLGDTDGVSLRNEKRELTETVKQVTDKLTESQRQLVKLTQMSKVEQAASIHAGNSMDSQQQQIRELERELMFFRSIMAPEESEKGLQISRFSWQQHNLETINWQISLIQAGSQGRTISGFVNVELVAMQDGEQKILHLTNEENNEKFNFRFKYFQHLSGNLKLNDDLAPISVNIVAYPTLKGQPIINRQFPWQPDEEKIANVE